MNTLKTLVLAVLLALGSSCSHTVKYKLTDQDRWTGPKINKVVRVVPLADQTTQATNKVLHLEDAKRRTNYRKGYRNGELAINVTAMVVKHLSHSGLFKQVVLNGEQPCDQTERNVEGLQGDGPDSFHG
jgi:hypothetical protein